jgi:hypothetical protein
MPRPPFQDCIRIVWRITHVFDRVLPAHDEHCAWGPCIFVNAKVVPTSAGTCWVWVYGPYSWQLQLYVGGKSTYCNELATFSGATPS